MPPGFPNMGGMANGNINASASIQQRRQLGLIAMAQNQQSQNGPGNFNKFNQQQQQFREQQQLREREQQQQQQFQAAAMNHSSPGDIFSSPGMSNEAIRRPSPHPVNIQSTPNMAQGPAPQAGNIVTPASNGGRIVIPLQELSNRAMSVRHNITQIEGQIASVSQQINVSRGTPQEAPLMQRLKDLSLELSKSKDYLQKLIGMANYSLRIHPMIVWFSTEAHYYYYYFKKQKAAWRERFATCRRSQFRPTFVDACSPVLRTEHPSGSQRSWTGSRSATATAECYPTQSFAVSYTIPRQSPRFCSATIWTNPPAARPARFSAPSQFF